MESDLIEIKRNDLQLIVSKLDNQLDLWKYVSRELQESDGALYYKVKQRQPIIETVEIISSLKAWL